MKKSLLIILSVLFLGIAVNYINSSFYREPLSAIPIELDGSYNVKITYSDPGRIIYETEGKVKSHEVVKLISRFELKEMNYGKVGYAYRLILDNWRTDMTIFIVDMKEKIIGYNDIHYKVDQENFDELIRLIDEYK